MQFQPRQKIGVDEPGIDRIEHADRAPGHFLAISQIGRDPAGRDGADRAGLWVERGQQQQRTVPIGQPPPRSMKSGGLVKRSNSQRLKGEIGRMSAASSATEICIWR